MITLCMATHGPPAVHVGIIVCMPAIANLRLATTAPGQFPSIQEPSRDLSAPLLEPLGHAPHVYTVVSTTHKTDAPAKQGVVITL